MNRIEEPQGLKGDPNAPVKWFGGILLAIFLPLGLIAAWVYVPMMVYKDSTHRSETYRYAYVSYHRQRCGGYTCPWEVDSIIIGTKKKRIEKEISKRLFLKFETGEVVRLADVKESIITPIYDEPYSDSNGRFCNIYVEKKRIQHAWLSDPEGSGACNISFSTSKEGPWQRFPLSRNQFLETFEGVVGRLEEEEEKRIVNYN